MFAIEINFNDSPTPKKECIFLRRHQATIGAKESSHVQLENVGENFGEIKLNRRLGRTFACRLSYNEKSDKLAEQDSILRKSEAIYEGYAEVILDNVLFKIATLDHDLRIFQDESQSEASLRVLKSAFQDHSPTYPAVAVFDEDIYCCSFLPDSPIYIGRSRKCDFRLDYSFVDNNQLRIDYIKENSLEENLGKDKFEVEDTNSFSGTYYKGEKFNKISLESGEELEIANSLKLCVVATDNDFQNFVERNKSTMEESSKLLAYPCIIAVSPQIRPEKVVLPISSTISIGRDPSSNIWIREDHISRLHLEIKRNDFGDFVVIDRSINGTSINDTKLPKGEEYLISDATILDLGKQIEIAICFDEQHEIEQKRQLLQRIENNENLQKNSEELSINLDDPAKLPDIDDSSMFNPEITSKNMAVSEVYESNRGEMLSNYKNLKQNYSKKGSNLTKVSELFDDKKKKKFFYMAIMAFIIGVVLYLISLF